MRRLLILLPLWALAGCSALQRDAFRPAAGAASDPLPGRSHVALAAIRGTLTSAVNRPVTTATLAFKVLWRRPGEAVGAGALAEPFSAAADPPAPGTRAFEAWLDAAGMPAVVPGKLTWLVDGDAYFPELARQISGARRGIDVQVYLFDNDEVGVLYGAMLRERARELPVRVMFDDLGTKLAHLKAPETPAPPGFQPPADMEDFLEDGSRVRVRQIRLPWLVTDHTKLLVFDRRTAFVGGMNIGREYRSEWHDLMAKVEGPVVGDLAAEYERNWRAAGPLGDLVWLRPPSAEPRPASVAGQVPMRVLLTDPSAFREEIRPAMLLAIRAARERIWLQNPYVAHDAVVRALEAAARRGVDVRLVLPEETNERVMQLSNLSTARRLLAAGAKIHLYPRMTHMKVMICDGWATFGSANFDTLSLRINHELNLAFSDPAGIRRLEREVFLPDFRASRRMRPDEPLSPLAPLAEALADQL